MDRYRMLSQLGSVLGVGVGVVVAQWCLKMLASDRIPLGVPTLLALIVVFAVSGLTRWLAERALDRWQFLRRAFLGNQFIDGVWIDVVKDGNRPVTIGITRFMANGASIRASGQSFYENGEAKSTYTSSMIKSSWPTMQFVGQLKPASGRDEAAQYYGEVDFAEEAKGVHRYHGFFVTLFGGGRLSLEGWKITDSAALEKLAEPKARAELLRTYFARASVSAQQEHCRNGPESEEERIE